MKKHKWNSPIFSEQFQFGDDNVENISLRQTMIAEIKRQMYGIVEFSFASRPDWIERDLRLMLSNQPLIQTFDVKFDEKYLQMEPFCNSLEGSVSFQIKGETTTIVLEFMVTPLTD